MVKKEEVHCVNVVETVDSISRVLNTSHNAFPVVNKN